jgi:hypothetical protein
VAAGVAFVIGYAVRVAALWFAWEEPLACEPSGVYMHNDGRPLLGRKLRGKSQRELERPWLGRGRRSAERSGFYRDRNELREERGNA